MTGRRARRSVETNRPPLIAHVVHQFACGGMENTLANLVNSCPRDRYRHVVISLKRDVSMSARLHDGVEVFDLDKRPGKSPRIYVRLYHLLRRLRPAIVHTRNAGTLYCVPVARLAGAAAVVHSEHGIGDSGTGARYLAPVRARRLIDPLLDRRLANSRFVAERFVRPGSDGSGVVVIHNGVRNELAGRERRVAAGARDRFVVGFLGRLEPVKDPELLVEAFHAVVERAGRSGPCPHLVMAGAGSLSATLRDAVARYGLTGRVRFTGERHDIAEYLDELDLLVAPSRHESCCNAILEAMAAGLPVVASRSGGTPEIVVDGKTGTLVPPRDPESLATAISAYINEPRKCDRQGAAGRRRVKEHFTMDRMMDRYLALYDGLLD